MELIRNAPVERLTFDDGSWVGLKSRLSVAERKRLAAGAVTFEYVDGRMVPHLDVAGAELAALHIGIVEWSFPDEVTPENIDCLDEGSAAAIKACLDQLWKPRSDDERKNSRGGGAPPSATEGELPPSSGG